MRRFLCLAVILGMGFTAPVRGEAPAKKTGPAPSVERLIEQLGAKDFRVRDAASKAIAVLGISALPALQKGRAASDPEIRRRLDELIPPLERAATLMPKRITLQMTNKPINDVLSELTRQTGYKLAGMEGQGSNEQAKKVYTFHFEKLPFWEALDKICEAAGMVLQQNWGDDALHLCSQDAYVPFTSYNGPFKVVANGFNYYRNNNFGQVPRNPIQAGQLDHESLHLNLNIAVEPKLPLLRVGLVKLIGAEDDQGHSMVPSGSGNGSVGWSQHNYWWGGSYRAYFHPTQAYLVWPSKTSRTVKYMKGVIPITLLADQKPSVITDKVLTAKGKKFQVGDATFHIEDVSELPGKQYQFKMSVTENSKDNPQDYSRIQSLQQRLELQDAKGTKHPSYLNFLQFGGPTNAQFTITTQSNSNVKVGPPAKLVYYAWVLMEHEVEFEFRDLPLP